MLRPNVRDEKGESFPAKTVLPVQSGSADVRGDGENLPGSRRTDEQRQALRQYSDALKARLGAEGQMTLASVSRFLQSQEGFADTADVYRLPKQGRVVKFLRLFGFELTGTGPGIIVRKPSRATGEARGRPAGATDLVPRIPRRGLPAAQSITFQPDNPFRAGSARHNRYEAYKGAGTVGEARRLGATPQDFQAAFNEGYAVLA